MSQPTAAGPTDLETVGWAGDPLTGHVRLIDQTLLPGEFQQIDCRDVPTLWEAIRSLRVRGAPAIGVAAAYGAALGARDGLADGTVRAALKTAADSLRTSRPTAVNLFWALDRIERVADQSGLEGPELVARLVAEAHAIAEEDRAMCRAMQSSRSAA